MAFPTPTLATLTVQGNSSLNSVTVTGGTIDATAIGSTTTATGAFTTLTSTGGALNGTLGASSPAGATVTTLTASGTVSGAGFSTYLASPPAIGGTTANSATFTTLTQLPQAAPTLVNGVSWSDSTQLCERTYQGSLETYVPGVLFTQTATVTTSGTSASTWIGAGVGSVTIPANYLVAGKTIRIKAWGTLTTAATPGTITAIYTLGSNNIFTTGAVTPAVSLSNSLFDMDLILTMRTSGSSGTAAYYMQIAYATGSSPSAMDLLFAGTVGAVSSINTTVSNTINFTTANNVSSGAVFTVYGITVESLA